MSDRSPAYCPCYCEENIWQLCGDPRVPGVDKTVLMVANHAGEVALWCQRAGADGEGLVVWDYHVVLAARDAGRWWIWDLDTTLALPTPAQAYLAQTFRPLPPRFAPLFRLIPCAQYRHLLRSDRRHMRDELGAFIKRPPDWPAIGQGFNLDRLLDMGGGFGGAVVDRAGLRDLLGVDAAWESAG